MENGGFDMSSPKVSLTRTRDLFVVHFTSSVSNSYKLLTREIIFEIVVIVALVFLFLVFLEDFVLNICTLT